MAGYYGTDYSPLLDRVLQEELGLAIKTNNVKRMQIEIDNYIADHSGFSEISAAVPSIPDHVFLVRKSAEDLL